MAFRGLGALGIDCSKDKSFGLLSIGKHGYRGQMLGWIRYVVGDVECVVGGAL